MYKITINSKNTEETLKIGEKFASFLEKGDLVVLTGDLGAGKTKFVEGFLAKFGLQNEISSPTFNIVNEYASNSDTIYHFDVYRLEDSDEFYAIGGEEYFENGICLMEWGELISDILPKDFIHIFIKKDDLDENKRTFEFTTSDNSKYVQLLEKFKEELN